MRRNVSDPIPRTPTQALRDARKVLLCRRSWLRLLTSLTITAAVTLALFSTVFGLALVQGDSMRPAFQAKDIVFFLRVGDRARSDVIILREEESTMLRKFIKRVVGIPGDTVHIDEQGNVLINGELLAEPYAVGKTGLGSLQYPVILGKDEYFVLGDNRENSRDSRSFGAIKVNQIEGNVIAVLRTGSKNERW